MLRLLCFAAITGCVFCSNQDDLEQRIIKLERRQKYTEEVYQRKINGLKHELQEMKKLAAPAQPNCDSVCMTNLDDIRGRLDEIESKYSNRSKRFLAQEVTSPVAFYAHLSAAHPTTGYRQPIIFETDVTNVGNAYEPTNGIFIAPTSGVYAFFWNILNDQAADIHTSLASSRGNLGNTYTSRPSGRHSEGSGFAVVHLNQGTHVWVEKEEGFGDFLQIFSSFSGFLLYADL